MSLTALLIGGTGPTGPDIVSGLLERDYHLTMLHGGLHEAELETEPHEHLHADPHFRESLEETLGSRSFDLIVATYGRLRMIADLFGGRAGRLVGVGSATGIAAGASDPRWGRIGRPVNVREEWTVLETDDESGTLGRKMAEAHACLLGNDTYDATYLGYTTIYGPRQPAPLDWCIVRRILDGRRRMVIADGGLRVESRMFARNAAHAVLGAVDNPAATRNETFFLADQRQHTTRQRIEAIARCLGVELELVDLPFAMAVPCHPYWKHEQDHRYRDTRRIYEVLGHRDPVDPDDGLAETVEWLVSNQPERGGAVEQKLGDPFDYPAEDRLMDLAAQMAGAASEIELELPPMVHQYRHPTARGQAWAAPGSPQEVRT